jgi:hypothetical protein
MEFTPLGVVLCNPYMNPKTKSSNILPKCKKEHEKMLKFFELSVLNCLGFSKLHSRLQSRTQIASTMLAVYDSNVCCMLHETSNACIVSTIQLFYVDYDA